MTICPRVTSVARGNRRDTSNQTDVLNGNAGFVYHPYQSVRCFQVAMISGGSFYRSGVIIAAVSKLLTAFRLAVGFAVAGNTPDSVAVAAVVPAPAGSPQRPRNALLSKAP